ncbi:neurexin protein binding [Desmophyllum pertusum]|uniref:Neurexin protein binding n=1 Tax=Desmophyllum pertusum TaxID=174260 RepID=A0A9W9ZWF8_9CNID|nr:neurexin protein binding [Desmophyllum pertusum]
MIMSHDIVKDGVSLELLESIVRNGMIYAREKSKLVEDLVLFEFTDSADSDNKIDMRQLMMDCFSYSGFVAPAMLEAKALAKNIPEPFVNASVTKYSETEKGLSLYIMKLWTDFAKYGSPNPPDSEPSPVTWPKFTEEEQEYLVLDLKPRLERRYEADGVAFWNEIVPKMVELTQTEKTNTGETAAKDEL